MRRVYIETTIVSYLTARPSRDVVVAGHQEVTREWWDLQRSRYELCASQLVISEASAGDPTVARERLEVLNTMTLLETPQEALNIAKELIRQCALPRKCANDSLHIAIAATNAVPFLLTWNCRHLANATMRPLIESVCATLGFAAPIICTPEELSEDIP